MSRSGWRFNHGRNRVRLHEHHLLLDGTARFLEVEDTIGADLVGWRDPDRVDLLPLTRACIFQFPQVEL